MEGVITCGVAIFAAIFLVKFPDEERNKPSLRFLTPEKLGLVIDRLNAERGDADAEPFTLKRFLQPATEWYIYSFPFILLSVYHLHPPGRSGTKYLQSRHHSCVRHGFHAAYHPPRQSRFQHRHVPMPGRTTLYRFWRCHVPRRLVL